VTDHELTEAELVSLWSVLTQEDREILSSVIADKVVHPERTRTLSEAVAECEAKRRRQLKKMKARLDELGEWQQQQRGRNRIAGRPKAQRNRYSCQQLQALSRAWDRFTVDHGAEPDAFAAFVRSLEPAKRAWLGPKGVRADTVRKLIQQGWRLREAAKAWRDRPDVREALYRLMQMETDRREVNRIVRELSSLHPGTEIAERRLTSFVSETMWRHLAMRRALGIDDSFIKIKPL
jgi:hypothetical protein